MVRHGHAGSVHRWLDGYMRRLEDFPRGTAPIGGDWREALGDPRRVADWTAYFRREVTRQPWRRVLGTWWPRLLPGVAAAATHGVIRVGHAVRALLADGDDAVHVTELAHGLAYWAARWQPVPGAAAGLGLPAAGLVAYGEAGHILPVTTPDVPGDLGIDRFQVTDWLCAGAKQAERVDNLHPGHAGKGKQVVDSGEAITACARREHIIHRAPADPQVTQAQIAKEGDERVVCRAEQVACHPGIAGIERSPFETQPGEIV